MARGGGGHARFLACPEKGNRALRFPTAATFFLLFGRLHGRVSFVVVACLLSHASPTDCYFINLIVASELDNRRRILGIKRALMNRWSWSDFSPGNWIKKHFSLIDCRILRVGIYCQWTFDRSFWAVKYINPCSGADTFVFPASRCFVCRPVFWRIVVSTNKLELQNTYIDSCVHVHADFVQFWRALWPSLVVAITSVLRSCIDSLHFLLYIFRNDTPTWHPYQTDYTRAHVSPFSDFRFTKMNKSVHVSSFE